MSEKRPDQQQSTEIDALRAEIAELRRLNEDLHQLAADPVLDSRLAAIIESSDDAIISKTLEGIIRTWNYGAERIFGWKAEEVIGKPIYIIIPPDRHAEEPEILAKIQRGERIDHFETQRITKDGRLIDISVTISPVRDRNGQIVAASKIARDVSQQKRFQSELQKAKEEAERANQSKDQFLSVLSHELRTPLTPVLAEMSFLEEMPDLPAPIRNTISMIRRNVETEARLVDDLLDLTRITRGKLKLHFEAVDLNEAIRAVTTMMQSQMDRKRIELKVALRAKHHFIWADPGRLQQILLNLVSNAVKFTPDGGSISIRSANDGDDHHVRVEVADTGTGIEPQMMSRIFAAFEQASSSRRLGGLGLGLSIAKSLVEMHEGSIRAASGGLNQGTCMTLELPTTAEEPQKTSSNDPRLRDGKLNGFRILLVEDHGDTRIVMTRLLEGIGCRVVSVGTVHEAVEVAGQQDFDLLISDIGLPDGSGMDILSRIDRSKPMHAIALSGFGQEDDLVRSRDAGFEAHLTKPINFRALRETVSRYAAASD